MIINIVLRQGRSRHLEMEPHHHAARSRASSSSSTSPQHQITQSISYKHLMQSLINFRLQQRRTRRLYCIKKYPKFVVYNALFSYSFLWGIPFIFHLYRIGGDPIKNFIYFKFQWHPLRGCIDVKKSQEFKILIISLIS